MSRNGILPKPTRLQHQGLLLSPITFWHQGFTCASTNLFWPTFCDNLFNATYSISASFQMKLSFNSNFPYRLMIIVEKYLLMKHIVLITWTKTVSETGETVCQDSNLLFGTSLLGVTYTIFDRSTCTVLCKSNANLSR